ncbi:MAG: hypothetical protein Fur0041_09190 [Bacteroidia bacterium]
MNMKLSHKFFLMLTAFAALSFTVLNNKWTFKTEEASVTFHLPNEGSKGSIKGLSGELVFDPANYSTGIMKASVKVNTLTTGIDIRDKHLMTNDYFDEAKHPDITFTAESFSKTDTGFVATGKLAMRDSVKTIQVPFTFSQENNKAVIKARMDLQAGDYGVGKKSKKETDRVVVDITVPLFSE